MTDIQFLQLMKSEIADFYFEDSNGKCKSTLQALELVQMFREQIQQQTISDFLNVYKILVPDHEARHIAADKLTRHYQKNSKNNYENKLKS